MGIDAYMKITTFAIIWIVVLAIGSTYNVSYAAYTGSMEPFIHGGDTLYTARPWIMGELKVGDVVSFKANGNESDQFIHRIVEIRNDGTIVTKGDANSVIDEGHLFPGTGWMQPVKKEWVTGKLVYIWHK
jgi:signal peptidase I